MQTLETKALGSSLSAAITNLVDRYCNSPLQKNKQ